MEVIFVNYAPFGRASGIHIFHLANELEKLGVRSTVYVPSDVESTSTFGVPRFRARSFRTAKIRSCVGGAAPRIIVHAWTTRERVRRLTETICLRRRSKYIVHLEDNEAAIRSAVMDGADPEHNGPVVPGELTFPEYLSHPRWSRAFLERASGITCIVKRLEDFVPENLPRHVIWPACEAHVFTLSEQPNEMLRRQCGYGPDDFVVVYPGNVHAANAADVGALYAALAQLNGAGHRVRLLRIGEDHVSQDTAKAGLQAGWMTFMSVPDQAIPDYLECADALVQPGHPNIFNEYRFPSKIPMFLASGRPVILINFNSRLPLIDEEHCLLLQDGKADEIAAKLKLLINNQQLRRQLGRSGRSFALAHFSWKKSASELLQFYRCILEERPDASF